MAFIRKQKNVASVKVSTNFCSIVLLEDHESLDEQATDYLDCTSNSPFFSVDFIKSVPFLELKSTRKSKEISYRKCILFPPAADEF